MDIGFRARTGRNTKHETNSNDKNTDDKNQNRCATYRCNAARPIIRIKLCAFVFRVKSI